MHSANIKFIIWLVVLTALCLAGQYMWNSQAPAALKLYHGLPLLIIFPITIAALHLYLTRPGTNAQSFTRNFMASSGLKLFVFAGVLVIFVMFSKQDVRVVAVHFLVYYALFTVFEVLMLQKAIKKK
jgi:hypothetical protein